MKLWRVATSLTVSLLILSGCGTPTPATPESAVIDKTLPTIVFTKNSSIVGMKSVAFEWKSVAQPNVEGIYVYRVSPKEREKNDLAYYATISNRFATHFLDRDVVPNTKYTYAFKTYSKRAEGIRSRAVTVQTLPVFASVSWIHSITGMPRAAKIIWRPHSNERVNGYIIERKNLQEDKWEKLATIDGRLNAEYIDTDLDDNCVYLYRVRSVTYDNIISAPSKVVKVVTKPLPFSIENIKATRNLPYKIDISWSPSKQKDFAYYALYRSDNIDGSYTLIAKLQHNRFEDKIKENGKVYFYRVSAVDRDGLESLHDKSSIQGMTLVAPNAPGSVDAKLIGDTIKVEWSRTDPRSVRYIVKEIRKYGWLKEDVAEYDIYDGTIFVNKNIEPDSIYIYRVFALDQNSIMSGESVPVKIVTPKSKEIVVEHSTSVKSSRVQKAPAPEEVESKDVVSTSDNLDLSGL